MRQAGNRLDRDAVGDSLATLLDAPVRMAAAFADALGNLGASGCTIPPPCWEPRPAGSCSLTLPPGGTGTVLVHVFNCDWTRRVIMITGLGKLAGWLTLEPTTLVVDPQERATFQVRVRVPDGVAPGQGLSGPLLVRGCVDHFIRLEVAVDVCAGRSCCDVTVRDCPDHVHHWYDHFYCPRPCRDPRTAGVQHG